jgi:hypothetical protein
MFTISASAFAGWEANITVSSDNAESRLSFGQKADATDLTDGLYDVPALLSGAIRVYFQTEEGSFWRDIRAIGADKEWQLQIASQTGMPVDVAWNPADFPAGATVTLIDASNAQEIDMKSSSNYTLEKPGNALLRIEVTDN